MNIDLSNTYIDFESVEFEDDLEALEVSFNPNNGEIYVTNGDVQDFSDIDGIRALTFEVHGTPELCIDDFIDAFSTYNPTLSKVICNNGEITVNIPSPDKCFDDGEEICGNIQKANLNCNQQGDNAIVGVEVNSDDGCGNAVQDDTDNDGYYCFTIFEDECVTISVDNSECPECVSAVTELDLAFLEDIRDEILGRSNSLTRAQVLAADVNNSGNLSMLDFLLLHREFLGIAPGISVECAFYAASEMSESDLYFDKTVNSCEEMDFVMVVPGDINGNCNDCDFGESAPTPIAIDTLFEVRTDSGDTIVKNLKPIQAFLMTFRTSSSFQDDDFVFLISGEDYLIDSIWANNNLTVFIASDDVNETLPTNTDLFSIESTVTLSGHTQYAWKTTEWYSFEFSGYSSRIIPENTTNIALIQHEGDLKYISNEDTGKGSIYVYSIDGRPLYTTVFNNVKNGEFIELPLTNIQGLIFIRVEAENVKKTQTIFIP